MPFMYGSGASHDDTGHFGSAKRGVANGVAALNAGGYLQVPGARIYVTRDGANQLLIYENTSSENAFELIRVGANDYQGHIRESNILKRIQTESMKDVASGIVAQDANGDATVTGDRIYLTEASNIVAIGFRTANEIPVRITRKGSAPHYMMDIWKAGAYDIVAALDASGDIPHMRPKAASANLRHSEDSASGYFVVAAYTKEKQFTFANGISGTIRTAFDMQSQDGATTVYARIYKNGVAIGTEQSTSVGPVTKTEDINYGVLAPGDTIELWIHSDGVGGHGIQVTNFRLYYDNAADTVLVAGVTGATF